MAELYIDGAEAPLLEGGTLFESAEAIDLRVPTSCVKQGKCRECLLEIEAGGELLSERSLEESHLGEGFRLACQTHVVGEGTVRVHTMRRSAMRIVDDTTDLPASDAPLEPRPGHGVALDLGTTTVALRLYDLTSGRLVATQSFENPQRFGGSDVMARIHYDGSHRGRLLQRTLLGYLRQALERFPVPLAEVREVVVAANTTMRDLLFGLDVHSIGQKPYRSLTEHEMRQGRRSTTSLSVLAKKLRLPLHPEAVVYGLPLIGSHVGADAAACLLATGMMESEDVAVLMDIGTNTELLVGNRHRIVAASCPAGPAFEGGGVLCGMPGLEGAIERVALAADGAVSHTVIGGGAPRGICGSGLVDLLGELLRTGRMNEQGRFEDGLGPSPSASATLAGVREDVGGKTFVVDAAHGIVFTERDMNELAQAKGANVAGLRITAEAFGLELDDIERFYLAGGFARHIDPKAARRIGLVPDLPDEKLLRVGNAALEGASRALLSLSLRARLEEIVKRVEHVELETHPRFFDYFVEGCQFVPVGTEVHP